MSPGAGDAAIMVATILETLRVLSQTAPHEQEAAFVHSIVFLINGAEEIGLIGSHAFITKHRWAKSVRMFINLDSGGAAGRDILFQTTSNSPWLTELYGQAVPHPFAFSTAQELFESGLIPSDTDFRIFRDHGQIPGE